MSARLQRSLLLGAVLLSTGAGALHGQAQDPRSRPPSGRPSVPGVHGLVTSGGHALASMAGVRILMAGGNAFDASVATAATLNVVEPQMSGIAGNGFLTFYHKETDEVLSLMATGAAPKAVDGSRMTAEQLSEGASAGIVPGLFGGWIRLLQRYGTRSLGEVLAPAIDYAGNGHPIEPDLVQAIERRASFFAQHPTSAALFLPGGAPPTPRSMWKQPGLAATMKGVVAAEKAALDAGKSRHEALEAAFEYFYRGPVAQELARFAQANGGFLTEADLASYEPRWETPIHTTYRGFDVYSTPSTSRGGLEVLMQLNLVEGFDLASYGPGSPTTYHLMAEAIKVAKSDIYAYTADPAFVVEVPHAGLLSKEYAASRRAMMQLDQVIPFPEPGKPAGWERAVLRSGVAADGQLFPEETAASHTTSFSVADRFGNVVAVTPTLGSLFGNGVVMGETGLLLNNGMRIGSTSPYPDHINYVRGGQIPILNNSPIIVMRDGEFHLSLGSPGGETIGQTQFQVLVRLLDFGMGIQEAIEAPRFSISADPNFYRAGSEVRMRIESRVPADVINTLLGAGHRIDLLGEFAGDGSMQGILRDPLARTLNAGADPRRPGYAVGFD